jgi:hypothetical protein
VTPVLLLTLMALLLFGLTARTHRQRLAISIPLAGMTLGVVLGVGGCGGGSSGGSNTPLPLHGTQPGNYTVTITGTSGVISHTTTVSLTVN